MPRPRQDGSAAAAPERRVLTDALVRRAPAADRRRRIYDAAGNAYGLTLVVEPSGKRSFKVPYRHHGRPRLYHLGDATKLGLKEARQLAKELWVKIASGDDPQAEKLAARKADTFGELLDRYVEEYAKRKNRSWRQADTAIRRHALRRWRPLPAAEVTRAEVRRLHAAVGATAPVAADALLAHLSGLFGWAIKNEVVVLPANPCSGVERFGSKSRERVLSAAEMPTFWEGLDDVDPVAADALRLVLLTGQRPGEIRHMRREHIDGRWWTLPGEPDPVTGWPGTKNGQSHEVWLSDTALAIVEDGGDGWVLPGARGGPAAKLDTAMRSLSFEPPVRPHDLRRTFATLAASLGVGRDAIDRLLNHRDGGIAGVYDRHRYRDENRAVWSSIAARVEALVNGKADDEKIVAIRS
ncbi:MAG: site-specific integrase [Acetobacterales bacterium]